jgi:HSP20 family molecular chaperone IbpA
LRRPGRAKVRWRRADRSPAGGPRRGWRARARCRAAHVPGHRGERGQEVAADDGAQRAGAPRELGQQRGDECGQVLEPRAQRRERDLEHREAEVEVLAEAPGTHGLGQVAVRRRDDSRVEGERAHTADALEAAVLERAQELRLERRVELADLVEEERAAAGELEASRARRRRPGEGTASWPKSSLSIRLGESAAQSTWTKGPALRPERAWTAAAARPFPLPVSPRSRTVVSAGATRASRRRTSRSAAESPARGSG